jgi:hypothetical protein
MTAQAAQRKKSMSLRFRWLSRTPWETVAFEIIEGLAKAVVLIASTAAMVVLGIILAAMSSLP